jgi:hypothetical protein
MSNYVTLLGAEEVQRAAGRMESAAREMQQAASAMEHTFEMHRRWADDWLQRLATTLEGAAST